MIRGVILFAAVTLVAAVSFGATIHVPSQQPTGTVTDYDGNVYQTVKIGSQIWMAENLKVTHYRNGDVIPNVTGASQWVSQTNGAWCSYNNDSTNVPTYGRLYNWYATNDSRGVAPAGWHVPSDEEWKQLEAFLGLSSAELIVSGLRGTVEGGKLKETGTSHWNSPNSGATNEHGFSALPAGGRNINGDFINLGYVGYFQSSSLGGNPGTWYRYMTHDGSQIFRGGNYVENGIPIRCVKDPDTVTDIDGNVYKTITVGDQTWMVENLKVTHYSNGDAIPNVTEDLTWNGLSTGAYCDYLNNPSYATTYGRLYNWFAVSDTRNIAPVGWHVASDSDWQELANVLGGDAMAGGKLKESGGSHWYSPNLDATNAIGFTLLPAGARDVTPDRNFVELGQLAYLWTSTPYNGTGAWARYQYYYRSDLGHWGPYVNTLGFSARCVKNRLTTKVTQLTVENESLTHVVSQLPKFMWTYVADSGLQDSIQVEVSADAEWSVAEMWATGTIASTDTAVDYGGSTLNDGVTYFARIRVHALSGWSNWYYTSFHMNTPPTVPVPYAPQWPDITVSTTPDLSVVNATDAENDTLYYDYQVFRDSMLTDLAVEGTHVAQTNNPDSTSWTVTPPLDDNKYYYWRARAYDGYEYSAWSSMRFFIANNANEPPNPFTLIDPPDSTGPILYNRKPTFRWTYTGDPDPYNQVRYKLEMAVDPAFLFKQVIDSLYTSFWIPPDSLPYHSHYWWRVSAIDQHGATTASPNVKEFWVWTLGDVDHSNNVDISDLTRLIDYLYISFSPIDPRKVGDLDGDCTVDISDLTRLIDYMYLSLTPLTVGGCGP